MSIFRPPETERGATFYGDLLAGQRTCRWWGRERFDVDKALRSASIRRYFTAVVTPLLRPTDRVLDVGCGAGVFLPVIAPLCGELTGTEAAPAFVATARQVVAAHGLTNTRVVEALIERLPAPDHAFDVVLAVDVLHHLTDLEASLEEIDRVLKPGGRFVIFEPNKLNPLLFVGCLLDRNEWGLLALGRPAIYRRLLRGRFELEHWAYNGVIIGPDNRVNRALADLLEHPWIKPWLGWMLPKIFISARKPA